MRKAVPATAEALSAIDRGDSTDKETVVMTEAQGRASGMRGATSGSPQRGAQRLAAPHLVFELSDELERLKAEPSWQRGDRNANTLVKEPDFRIVLTALKAGAQLEEHQVAGRVAVQVLAGRVRMHLPDGAVELAAGRLIAFEPEIAHRVEALEESALLLTIGWPAGRGGA
jgi:quercetin dioxygenase-like cupin family protein